MSVYSSYKCDHFCWLLMVNDCIKILVIKCRILQYNEKKFYNILSISLLKYKNSESNLSPVLNDHLVLHFLILNVFLIFNCEFDIVFLSILIISEGRIFSSIDTVVALDRSIGMKDIDLIEILHGTGWH